jgi:uncharacterized protein
MDKVIIVSDSHGLTTELEAIYDCYKGETQYFIHCGDSELNVDHPLMKKFQSVQGNCDLADFPKTKVIEVENKKILFTHGHHHGVKFNLNRLHYFGCEHGVDVICFGHSHHPVVEENENMLIINPGSIRHNRGFFSPAECFAILEIDGDHLSVKHVNVKTFEEIQLKK